MTLMPDALQIDALPHRRMEAWKWTDLRAKLAEDTSGLSQAGLPKLSLPDGVSVSEETDSEACLLYTSPSPRDRTRSRMPSSA